MSPITRFTKCTICQRPVGHSWFVSDLGDVFCTSHANPSFCQGCRRPLTLGANGEMCAACLPTLFGHESQIGGSQQNVLTWLTGHIGPNQLHRVPVALENKSNFVQNQTGVTNWTYDGQHFDVGIRILRNVTPNIFEHTLAHEYGHVLLVAEPESLLFRGAFPDHRHVEEEGFCEVVKYLWLGECGTGHRQFDQRDMRNNPDPVYGDGFRMMWKVYERVGSIPALREHILAISAGTPKKKVLDFLRPRQPTPPPPGPIVDVPDPDIISPMPVAPGPVEGGSHRPTRDITLRRHPRGPAATEPTDRPRPMVTVNFTKKDSGGDQEVPVPSTDRPMRTIKPPPKV